MTGYNAEEVRAALTAISAAYDELMQAIGTDVQNKFIGGMAEHWACTQAQDFFENKFKEVCNVLVADTNKIFESVMGAINGAARAWAALTETEYTDYSFSVNAFQYDTSMIQENIGGLRGIDKVNAESVASSLSEIAASADTALDNAASAVSTHQGFIGGDQAEMLINALNTIKTNLSNVFSEITTATDQGIKKTIEVYGDTAGEISKKFNGEE